MYFDKCQNINEFKERYRLLSKRFHPDLGGNTDLMKELNDEYEKGFQDRNNCKVKQEPKKNERSTYYNSFDAEEAIKAILEWAEDHPNFNTEFVESLSDRLESKGELSSNQEDALKNIIKKFRIKCD